MDTTVKKLNRLCKWRQVFASWQLGTRSRDDPECNAVKHHRETTIILRAEVTALVGLLINKGVFTHEEFTGRLGEEASFLSAAYEKLFPGFKARDDGIDMNVAVAKETMKGWRP